MEQKRVAIVGSGCAGLGALWALKSTNHDVHLFEAADRLGGHTNTAIFEKDGRTTPVDSGFIVMNSATYREQTPLAPIQQMGPKSDVLQQTSLPSSRSSRYLHTIQI